MAPQSTVRTVIRLEGLAVMLAAVMLYGRHGHGWGAFALYFFVPDLSLLAYLAGPRLGALCYNCAHSYLGALSCLAVGYWFALPTLTACGLLWCAHIGFDRALGYGLKYSTGFRQTHLGMIGRAPT